jgi:hypothetical protein
MCAHCGFSSMRKYVKVNTFVRRYIHAGSKMTDCPICFEALDFGGKNCMRTECGHDFHASCMMMNVYWSKGFKCPYCRHQLIEPGPAHVAHAFQEAIHMDRERMNPPVADQLVPAGIRRLNGAPGIPHEGEMCELFRNEQWVRGTLVKVGNRFVLRPVQIPAPGVAPVPEFPSQCVRCG